MAKPVDKISLVTSELSDELMRERLSLGDIARETVENESVSGIRLGQARLDHAEHHVVGDELAGIHGGLGLLAQVGTGRYLGAQQVARGNLRDIVLFYQQLGLRSLAGTGRSQ